MIKLAICKIKMCGEAVLILGIGREFVEGDWFWNKLQIYTCEEYINRIEKFDPIAYVESLKNGLPLLIQSQDQADKMNECWKMLAEKRADYQGDFVLFKSINKKIPILKSNHEFNLEDCEQVEITLNELNLLNKELSHGDWTSFDEESWGK
ncbi:MAG: hypothetical protein EKK64_10400 [Neisseriaceae bacterium]|nr:MAG: hypothetical protein EKK64_10400 [Neisseriaceae bacterium]